MPFFSKHLVQEYFLVQPLWFNTIAIACCFCLDLVLKHPLNVSDFSQVAGTQCESFRVFTGIAMWPDICDINCNFGCDNNVLFVINSRSNGTKVRNLCWTWEGSQDHQEQPEDQAQQEQGQADQAQQVCQRSHQRGCGICSLWEESTRVAQVGY